MSNMREGYTYKNENWSWNTSRTSQIKALSKLGANKELMCMAPVKAPLTSKSRRLGLHILEVTGGDNIQSTTKISEN